MTPTLPMFLTSIAACTRAVEWAAGRRLDAATYALVPQPDWLLWFAARVGVRPKLLVRTVCAVAGQTVQYVPAPLNACGALATVDAWTRGEVATSEIDALRLRSARYWLRPPTEVKHQRGAAAAVGAVLSLTTPGSDKMIPPIRAGSVANLVLSSAASAFGEPGDRLYRSTLDGMRSELVSLIRQRIPWAAMPWRVHAWELQHAHLSPVEIRVLTALHAERARGKSWADFDGREYAVALYMAKRGDIDHDGYGGFQFVGVEQNEDERAEYQ